MEHVLSIDTWIKCKKEILGSNYVRVPCGWQGVLDEYTGHVKRRHSDSYVVLAASGSHFNWTLPYVGDRADKFLLQSHNMHILYELYYDGDKRLLRHRFLPYGHDLGTTYRYEIINEENNTRYEADGNVIVYEPRERRTEWTLKVQAGLID